MAALTRQDIQAVIENARGRLLDSVATRQDIQGLDRTTKNLTASLQRSQQLLRQEERQRAELIRRAFAVETRLSQLEHELQEVHRSLNSLINNQPAERIRERVIVTGSESQGYVYTPA